MENQRKFQAGGDKERFLKTNMEKSTEGGGGVYIF